MNGNGAEVGPGQRVRVDGVWVRRVWGRLSAPCSGVWRRVIPRHADRGLGLFAPNRMANRRFTTKFQIVFGHWTGRFIQEFNFHVAELLRFLLNK